MHNLSVKPSDLVGVGAMALLAALALNAPASAATVYMVESNAVNTNYTWSTASAWQGGKTPAANPDDDFVVGSGFMVRTPINAASATFPAQSLTIEAGGSLLLKTSSSGSVTIGDLRVAGTISNGNSTNQGNVYGMVTLYDGATLTTGTDSSRHINLYALVHGSGTVTIDGRGTVRLRNSANDFSGTWSVGGLNSTSTNPAILAAPGDGSIGNNVSVIVNANGRLDLDYDWKTTGTLTIDAGGTIALGSNLEVTGLIIDGVSLPKGTYTFSELDAAYDAFFVNGGSGSIAVVPEPASLAAGAALVLLGWRRRRPI